MGCKSCSPRHSFRCRVIVFLLRFGLDFVDLLSDWLLYADVSLTENGMVYGSFDDSVRYSLLAFSIIGSLTFLFETVNLWWEIFREDPWLDPDLVSAFTIWIEDLPQIAINVHIAWCREDPASVFQLFKASVVLIELAVRIIISLVRYCSSTALQEARERSAKSRRRLFYRVMIMLGLFINSACAIAVFLFTQTQRDEHGSPKINVPKSVFEDEYNDQRYFQNVSVFVHHPAFDDAAPSQTASSKGNWIRFMSVNDIRDRRGVDMCYNFVYEKTATHLKMALFVKEDQKSPGRKGVWRLSDCHDMDLATDQVTSVSENACRTSFFSGQARSVYITFSFIPPEIVFRRRIFGDIRYNVKIYENQMCKDYSDKTWGSPDVPSIHYYRTSADLSPEQQGVLLKEAGTGHLRFYRNYDQELLDVTSLWKTGWGKCPSSGSLAPNFHDSIPVSCTNFALPVAG